MARTPIIEAVLAVAHDIARRRHHPVVRATHVLAALFAAPGMHRRIRRRGFDADHLVSAVERVLDDAPSVAGYRDAGPLTTCPSIERALERAAKPVEAYGAVEIAPALEDTPELRGAFRPYVLDESLAERLRREAPGRDIADAMTWLLANDLDLAERLIDGGLDTKDLTTHCGVSHSDVLRTACDAARAAGMASVDATLLTAMFTSEIAYSAGYELPIIGEALDRLLHGAPLLTEVSDDEPAEVVFVNDPITAFTTVQGVLITHFGMNEAEASDVAMAIDARDAAVVTRTKGAPAKELAHVATKAARRAGHPLRIVVRARSDR